MQVTTDERLQNTSEALHAGKLHCCGPLTNGPDTSAALRSGDPWGAAICLRTGDTGGGAMPAPRRWCRAGGGEMASSAPCKGRVRHGELLWATVQDTCHIKRHSSKEGQHTQHIRLCPCPMTSAASWLHGLQVPAAAACARVTPHLARVTLVTQKPWHSDRVCLPLQSL